MRLGATIATYVLTGNVVLTSLLGLCPLITVWSSPRRALVVGCSLFFVCSLTAVGGWAVERFVLSPVGAGWLGLIAAMLLAAGATQLMEVLVRVMSPALAAILGHHTEQTMLSSAVLGITLNVTATETTLLESFVAALAGAGGYLLAALLMASVHRKIELEPVPRALRGVPVALITLSIMALAFMAFGGKR